MQQKELFEIPKKKEIIRALWWNQPYASLMLHGKIETRTYPTKVRGKVLICACKKSYIDNEVLSISGQRQMVRLTQLFNIKGLCSLEPYNYNFLPCGQVIAIGDLVDCRPMTKADEDKCFVQYREPWYEYVWNNKLNVELPIEKQLYCWVFENIKPIESFEMQIKTKSGKIVSGKQGWHICDEETINKIKLL